MIMCVTIYLLFQTSDPFTTLVVADTETKDQQDIQKFVPFL